ncbi:MAG: MTH938/NDUFAF3 family protein [Candidatus Aerophobetes bacterium]|nr:MTH938/NDUFAF3 family protein [Candidatus Aerophobetes bacterium]
MIDSYEFGHIVIEGKSYTSDIIIYPQKIDAHWWRKEGHLLLPQDLKEVLEEKPEVLIIGTGDSGLMKVPPETLMYIKSKGIEAKVEPTRLACRLYNKVYSSRRTIAALHLTC